MRSSRQDSGCLFDLLLLGWYCPWPCSNSFSRASAEATCLPSSAHCWETPAAAFAQLIVHAHRALWYHGLPVVIELNGKGYALCLVDTNALSELLISPKPWISYLHAQYGLGSTLITLHCMDLSCCLDLDGAGGASGLMVLFLSLATGVQRKVRKTALH